MNELKKQTLAEVCSYGIPDGDFVGLRYENGNLKIQFPLGYRHPETSEVSNVSELKKYRSDILTLISVLSAYSGKKESELENWKIEKSIEAKFPVHAYLQVIADFLGKGYYTETESVCKNQNAGKIHWARTIKQVKPQVVNNNIYYLNFITKQVNPNKRELITLIHKYCVHEAFDKIGWLFTNFVPLKPTLEFNASLFKSVLQTKMAKTFKDREQILFKNMLDIINFKDCQGENTSFTFGTNHFEYIWEKLVDEVYGTENKEKYYPHTYWVLGKNKVGTFANDSYKNSALRLDSIMLSKSFPGKIFILDSKYYKYGVSRKEQALPSSGSVIKQIAYGEYIDTNKEKFGFAPENIYNAFIIPYAENKKEKSPYRFGFASSENKISNQWSSNKSYYKIHGIFLDTKTLMQNHKRKDENAIQKLATEILKEI